MTNNDSELQDQIKRILQEKKIANEDLNLAFRVSAFHGDIESLRTLYLSKKIDINARGPDSGRTALHNLIINSDKICGNFTEQSLWQVRCILCFLMAEGADPHLKDGKNRQGKTALAYWDKMKNDKLNKAPKDFLKLIDDIFEIGNQINRKKEKLKVLLSQHKKQSNPEFILLSHFHNDNAHVRVLKRRFPLLQAMGYKAICYEWPYTSELPNAIPHMLEHHAKMKNAPKNEIQQYLQQAKSALSIEQFLKFGEVEVELLNFIQDNKLPLFCIDPFLASMDNREQPVDILSLRDEGMAVAIACTLATQQKAIGIAGIAHSKGISARLQRLMPNVNFKAFFVHSESENVSKFLPNISDTVLSISQNTIDEDLIFMDIFFSEVRDEFEQEIQKVTGLQNKDSALIFNYLVGDFALYNPGSNSKSSQKMRALLQKTK